MIDSKSLEKRFSIDVILQNLSPEERYLCKNKSILNDSSVEKICHINNSIFDTSNDLLKFVSETLGIDINLCNDNLASCINKLLLEFHDYCTVINPYFNTSNIETWCEESENLFLKCRNILDECCMLTDGVLVLNEASTVSDERIRENIYNDLDDNSILLLYGLLTNNYSSPYSSDMRNTVFNDIKNNRERSRIGNIILHSLKENNSENFSSIVGNYGLDSCKMAQSNGTVLIDELGTIKSISKVGDNKYVVSTLNESENALSDEDKWLIRKAGTISEYKEELENGDVDNPTEYFMGYFDMLHDDNWNSARRVYASIKDRMPEVAKMIENEYGDNFMYGDGSSSSNKNVNSTTNIEKKPEKKKDDNDFSAYDEGVEAFKSGKSEKDNPYKSGYAKKTWKAGYGYTMQRTAMDSKEFGEGKLSGESGEEKNNPYNSGNAKIFWDLGYDWYKK